MAKTKPRFIEPMLLLRTEKLPQGADWLYEIKLDGYRMPAIQSEGKVQLRSRRDNDYTMVYKAITAALQSLPDETVIDGEVARTRNGFTATTRQGQFKRLKPLET